MFIALTFPIESHGKSIKEVRDDILEKIRDTVAHAVMLDGELVYPWMIWKIIGWLINGSPFVLFSQINVNQ